MGNPSNCVLRNFLQLRNGYFMKKTLLAVVVCLAVGLLISAPVSAKTVVTKFDDAQAFIVNECNYCLMDVTCSGIAITSSVANANRSHFTMNQNLKLEAVDQCTGITYSGKANSSYTFNVSLDTPQLENTVGQRIKLKSDAGDELIVKFKSKTTINTNGDVTVLINDYSFECTP
jgi:hypothetical protein